MLFIFFFSLLVMEAREPPKLPTAFVHNQLIIQNQIIIQLVIQLIIQVIMVFKLKTSTTFVMEATEPLFFLARSAVELPTVVLAFTVNPNFTWWLSWSWESIFTKRRIYITCDQNDKILVGCLGDFYLQLSPVFSLVLSRLTFQRVPSENKKDSCFH